MLTKTFELKFADAEGKDCIIPLKWGNQAMYRACELASEEKDDRGRVIPLSLADFFERLLTGSFDFKTMCIFLQAAAECAARGPVTYTQYDYGDWIDACGGLLRTDGPLVDFVQYIFFCTVNKVTSLPGDKEPEEKKSLG